MPKILSHSTVSNKSYPGINIQYPISQLIVSGKKIIETRTYPIPAKYLNQEMALIETPGKEGKFKSRVIAIIKFTDCFQYKNKKEFYADVNRHCVTEDSIWAWEDKEKWGWNVQVVSILEHSQLMVKPKGIVFTKNIAV